MGEARGDWCERAFFWNSSHVLVLLHKGIVHVSVVTIHLQFVDGCMGTAESTLAARGRLQTLQTKLNMSDVSLRRLLKEGEHVHDSKRLMDAEEISDDLSLSTNEKNVSFDDYGFIQYRDLFGLIVSFIVGMIGLTMGLMSVHHHFDPETQVQTHPLIYPFTSLVILSIVLTILSYACGWVKRSLNGRLGPSFLGEPHFFYGGSDACTAVMFFMMLVVLLTCWLIMFAYAVEGAWDRLNVRWIQQENAHPPKKESLLDGPHEPLLPHEDV